MVKQAILAMLLGLILLAPSVQAESADEPEKPAVSTDADEQVVGKESGDTLPEQDQQINKNATSNQRSISSAIETFTPTEEISADNAVPFPVDI